MAGYRSKQNTSLNFGHAKITALQELWKAPKKQVAEVL